MRPSAYSTRNRCDLPSSMTSLVTIPVFRSWVIHEGQAHAMRVAVDRSAPAVTPTTIRPTISQSPAGQRRPIEPRQPQRHEAANRSKSCQKCSSNRSPDHGPVVIKELISSIRVSLTPSTLARSVAVERAMVGAVLNDPLCDDRSDTRKRFQVRLGCGIDIDPE